MPLKDKRRADTPQVVLVTAARNEAAYLPEWIFHHLYFGVSRIELHINRSQDQSEEIARTIASHVPELTVYNADAIDRQHRVGFDIQLAILKAARKRIARKAKRGDYTMFLDVDEFWVPTDIETPIQQVIAAAGHPAIAAFGWLNLISDLEPFAATLCPELVGYPDRLVKSAFRSKITVKDFNPHGVRPLWPFTKIWNGNGRKLTWRQPFRADDFFLS
ncbi:hypothetical protein AIOL_002837 [Candidatus Rhodobacter oscarellae]|uniref:Uncharacterized protein n=1 Tax=Candidatus Rhodobacter oscarellae TaxID=1675527 RepID=A0A0J9E7X8_9RHOB|nr:glycosyltransferase family 2 protein [Candidatus Rhodobacter lobularis]KMW57869.1 hypothetical protein AIOL_002837 [Candidatus Rhodobacter lobularis]